MKLAEILHLAPVIPVLTLTEAGHAVQLAHALVRGGLRVLEIDLRQPAALEGLAAIAAALPEAVLGAGGVLTQKELKRATKAGAHFATCPGFSVRLSEAADIPLLPAIATAGEALRAIEHGHDQLGLFPSAAPAAIATLKAFAHALPQARFCPAGANAEPIDYEHAPLFLAQPNVLCVFGAWITPSQTVAAGNWEHIEFLAHEAAALRRHQ